jgi:hypothetical protein
MNAKSGTQKAGQVLGQVRFPLIAIECLSPLLLGRYVHNALERKAQLSRFPLLPYRKDDQYLPQLMGEGDLPLKECIAALKSVGYDGWTCLETEKRWHPRVTPDPEITIPQYAQYMRAAWGSSP